MIRLQPPERTLDQLRALAASGSTTFARKAQAELQRRTTEALKRELQS